MELCLIINETDLDAIYQNIHLYNNKTHLFEIRADYIKNLSPDTELATIRKKTSKKLIFTIRKKCDGGLWEGRESERLEIYLNAVKAGFDYIDLELDTNFSPHIPDKTQIIRSYHNFSGTPDNLIQIFRQITKRENEIGKIAVMIKASADLKNFLELIRHNEFQETKRKILLAMGSKGLFSRVIGEKFKSLHTYVSIPSQTVAPGMIDIDKALNLYQIPKIGSKIRIYGIIGNPLQHSKSPLIHNNAMCKLGINAVYLPFELDEFNDFLLLQNFFDIQGCSVTIPYKKDAAKFVKVKSNAVTETNSCNTLYKKNNEWHGENTDIFGFLYPFKQMQNLELKKALILGYGSTASTVAFALKKMGISCCITGRNSLKGKKFSQEHGTTWLDPENIDLTIFSKVQSIIVNTTPLGTFPEVEKCPVPDKWDLSVFTICYDLIYNPPLTRFLQKGKDSGCQIISGKEMLYRQGEKQFELWTGNLFPFKSLNEIPGL